MPQPLTRDEVVHALDRWAGQQVAVRIVTESKDLVAVWCGQLGRRSNEKRPALFWPLLPASSHAEKPGVYLHDEQLVDAALHVGGAILELRQQGVTLNIRRL
jgi:hypothetical protein